MQIIFLKYLAWKYRIPPLKRIKFCPELLSLAGEEILNGSTGTVKQAYLAKLQDTIINSESKNSPAFHELLLIIFDNCKGWEYTGFGQNVLFSSLVWQALG